MALTDNEIKKAKAKEKAYILNDSGGLYLWITPGSNLTIALLRTPTGQQSFKISIHKEKRQEIIDRVAQLRQTAYSASRNKFNTPSNERGGR